MVDSSYQGLTVTFLNIGSFTITSNRAVAIAAKVGSLSLISAVNPEVGVDTNLTFDGATSNPSLCKQSMIEAG